MGGAIDAVSPEILAGLPARIPELRGHAVAVVAVGRDSDADGYPDIASFSNRCGIAADWCIAAPGVDVEIAIFGRVNGVAGQRAISSGNGTSFAAPMVSGGLAVMKQLFRGQLGSEELVGRLYKPGAGPRPAVIRPNPKRIGRMRYRRSRMAIAMRRSGPRMTSRTGGDARPRGDDDPCMALAPTTPRRRLTPKIPERAAQGAAGTLRINDASDVRPKACPGGSEA